MSPQLVKSWWRWLVSIFRGRHQRSLPPAQFETLALPEPASIPQEVWLQQLMTKLTTKDGAQTIASAAFWQRIDGLWDSGHELLAIEWVAKLTSSPLVPKDKVAALQYRLVQLCKQRGDLTIAVPHLEALSVHKEHGTFAHYQLGEHFRRHGHIQQSLRHYEAVIARDFDYPNVRARVHRLRGGENTAAMKGETIAGPSSMRGGSDTRYQLVRELGRGATAVVYQAHDTWTKRDVAIKLLHPHLASRHSKNARDRFFNEARIAASLRHPHILAILDLDEKTRRIVMDLAQGGTLRSRLRRTGGQPIRQALEIHVQTLSALAAAHRRGIVHRDLKPGNLIFHSAEDAPGTMVVLGDFGVAHLPPETDATQTNASQSSTAMGTIAYMSPEQRRGGDVDARSDIYAAAVVLFETIVGKQPWTRAQLLSGARTPFDLRLPSDIGPSCSQVDDSSQVEIPSQVDDSLIASLQQHLFRLGHPTPDNRPTTNDALAEARQLYGACR